MASHFEARSQACGAMLRGEGAGAENAVSAFVAFSLRVAALRGGVTFAA
jgi:hypothetical protein